MTEFTPLAQRAGIATHWTDAWGSPHQVAAASLQRILHALGLPCDSAAERAHSEAALLAPPALPPLLTADAGGTLTLPIHAATAVELDLPAGPVRLRATATPEGLALALPATPGYHRLRVGGQETMLAIAPPRGPSVAELTGRAHAWGAAVQLYALRRAGDGGIGDAGALREAAIALGARGADALALSPTHALFAAEPGRAGPYAPSSRLALNPMLADPGCLFPPEAVAAAWRDAAPATARATWESAPLIDWQPAGAARLAMLRALFAALPAHPAAQQAFAAFAAAAPTSLHGHALFEALHADHLARGAAWDWRGWPAALRDPASPAVAAFAAAHREEVAFHLFGQWLAAASLDAAQRAARDAGMGIGLVADLAIGMDPAGSHAWGAPGDLLAGLGVGAPPDELNRQGQGWGLTTFSPTALRATGYAPFLATIRAALRHAGGLRIDHVLGLRRLWVIPEGSPPTEGAYIAMPFTDLLRLVALEAHQAGALAIGEDLGTVPEGLRPQLAARGVLGMRVLAFERDGAGGFIAPAHWPADALAMTSTHDLPPVAGWWRGTDLAWHASLRGETPGADALAARAADRAAFWHAATQAGVAHGPQPAADAPDRAVDAAIAYAAATPAPLALIPAEDLLGLAEAPNLPGTTTEHPNWRRRLSAPLPDLLDQPVTAARLAGLAARSRTGRTKT